MSLQFTTLDVFTTSKFHGNPLAIIHIPSSTQITQSQKQLIAREFNLSETVFLHEPANTNQEDITVDIFTPIAEIPFAGHPTIGTSNYLLRHLNQDSKYRGVKALQIKAGRVPIGLVPDGTGAQLQVAHNVHIHKCPFPDTAFSHYPVVSIVNGMTFILAQLPSLEELAKPTENLLGTKNTYTAHEALDEGWRQGPIISYFFVDLGVDADGGANEIGVRRLRTRSLGSREDPATGSAASALCSSLTLRSAEGGDRKESGEMRRKYHITQGVEMGRQSDIFVEVALENDGTKVKEVTLSGTAVKVMEGRVDIPITTS